MTDTSEIFEPFSTADIFCEALTRIDQIGNVRRLVFTTRDSINGGRAVVAKLILPAEAMFDLAQTIAADRPVSAALAALPHDAIAN